MVAIAALFPGQGSQCLGMGQEFVRTSEVANEIFSKADSALGFKLSELCQVGPLETLTLTQNAQPAILTVSYISFKLLNCSTIQCAAGHSLGEYSALVCSGCLSFEDAVFLVHKRGRYMQEAVREGEGAMLAVMGPGEDEIKAVINQLDPQLGSVEIANFNSPGQIVVAGHSGAIADFAQKMSASGGKVIPLKVSAPFHCSLMKPAAEKLAAVLDSITFTEPRFPVFCNVTASQISSGEEARRRLKEQVCSSVRWTDSMNNMIAQCGVTHCIEFGPGGVLSKLLKRINSNVTRLEVFDPSTLEKTRSAL